MASMNVQVSGKHMDVGDALRSRIVEELPLGIGKYFERGGDADVVISRDRTGFKVDCAVRLASGHHLQSHGHAADAHAAFHDALAKIETRVRRYKRRLTSHATAASARAAETASLFVLRPPHTDDDDVSWDEHEGVGAPAAMIIAETEANLATQTVAMAVREMDLTGAQAIVFRNAAHGGLSVIYRRSDGNIGWIDPERAAARPARSHK